MRQRPALLTLSLLLAASIARAGAAQPDAKAKRSETQAYPYAGKVTGERVYVRAGDGINYTVLTVVGPGDTVRVKERRFDWLGIAVPETCTVWVHKSLLRARADGQTATVIGDRVNVRARPKASANVMGQLPEGATVNVVDSDGDWIGIAPTRHATAWIHRRFVRKTGPASAVASRRPPAGGAQDSKARAMFRDARTLYNAELKKPPKERDFTDVLAAYQEVAQKAGDPALARQAERARQRVLKIMDLHKTLQAASEPLDRFEEKYDKLEKEYKERAMGGGGETPQEDAPEEAPPK